MASKKRKIVSFGEVMLRLSVPTYFRFLQADEFLVTYGGGEANVAVNLAGFDMESVFVTRLPAHEIGQRAVNELRSFGVNTDYIIRGGKRVGIYYLENGASQRPSKVIYDRENSAFADLTPDMVDWDEIFEGADYFHWTGITAALGENTQECLHAASKAAAKAGAKISCDLNFRSKLWESEKTAQKVMNPLMEYVDVIIANEYDFEQSLGFKMDDSSLRAGNLDQKGYYTFARAIKKTYGFDKVAITLRESFSASRNGWSAILHDDEECSDPVQSKRYDIQIVDRVGGGDSFAAGLIGGLLMLKNSREALEFAVAASCLKHTIPGDLNLVSPEEVLKIAQGDGSGRVER